MHNTCQGISVTKKRLSIIPEILTESIFEDDDFSNVDKFSGLGEPSACFPDPELQQTSTWLYGIVRNRLQRKLQTSIPIHETVCIGSCSIFV
jgi:hypothetical protein